MVNLNPKEQEDLATKVYRETGYRKGVMTEDFNAETPAAKAHIRAQSLYSTTSYRSLEVPKGPVSTHSPDMPDRHNLLVVVPDGLPEGLVDLQLNTISPASAWKAIDRLAAGGPEMPARLEAEARQKALFADETPNVHANNVWNPSVGMTDHTSYMSTEDLNRVSIISGGGVRVPALGGHPGATVYSVHSAVAYSPATGFGVDLQSGTMRGPSVDEQILHEQRKTELRAIDTHPEKYSRPALARSRQGTSQTPFVAMSNPVGRGVKSFGTGVAGTFSPQNAFSHKVRAAEAESHAHLLSVLDAQAKTHEEKMYGDFDGDTISPMQAKGLAVTKESPAVAGAPQGEMGGRGAVPTPTDDPMVGSAGGSLGDSDPESFIGGKQPGVIGLGASAPAATSGQKVVMNPAHTAALKESSEPENSSGDFDR